MRRHMEVEWALEGMRLLQFNDSSSLKRLEELKRELENALNFQEMNLGCDYLTASEIHTIVLFMNNMWRHEYMET